MERGNLYDGRERLRPGTGRAGGVDARPGREEKPARPRAPSAVQSPYRTPITPASFYGKPERGGAARKRDAPSAPSPSAKQPKMASSPPRLQHTPMRASASPAADSSPDELNLAPLPLRARMRPKDAPSTQSLAIPLYAMYLDEGWYARDARLELVSFANHFTVMLGADECCKIAMRDIFNWTIGGEEHKLFVVSVRKASLASLLRLAPGLEPEEGKAHVYFWANASSGYAAKQWDALIERVRGSVLQRPASDLGGAKAAELQRRLQASEKLPMRLPSPNALPALLHDKATIAQSKPIAVRERRSTPQSSPTPGEKKVIPLTSPPSSPEPAGTVARRSARHTPADESPSVPILRYPASGPFAVTILESDLHRLDADEFLNDTLIEFGLRYLLEQVRQRDEALASQIHVFSSFFFLKMSEFRDRAKSYEQVRKWTNKVDIFSKKYLVIPIHEHMHWYLAIVVNPSAVLSAPSDPQLRRSARNTPDVDAASASPAPSAKSATPPAGRAAGTPPPQAPRPARTPTKIVPGERRVATPERAPPPEQAYVLVLDSLGSSHGPVKTLLRDYLRLEARDKKHIDADVDLRRLGDPVHVDVDVAEQPNYCDCGLYLLHNFQCFFSDPQTYFRDALRSRKGANTKDTPPSDLWRAGDMDQRRKHWQDLLRSLSEEWSST